MLLTTLPTGPQKYASGVVTLSGGAAVASNALVETLIDVQVGEPLLLRSATVQWSFRPPDVIDTTTDPSKVRRQATLEFDGAVPAWLTELSVRFRPYVKILAPSTGRMVHFDLGTFRSSLSPASDDGVVLSRRLDLAESVIYRMASRQLREPLQWNTSTAIVTQVKANITSNFGAQSYVDPSAGYLAATLAQEMVFETGTIYLEAYNAALKAVGIEPLIQDEYEVLQLLASADLTTKAPEWSYALGTTVAFGGSLEPLMPEVPNVIEFYPVRGGASLPTEGAGFRTVTNASVGPASYASRGEYVYLRVQVDAEDQTALDNHAQADSEYIFAGGGQRMGVKVALNPLHSDRDVVTIEKPRFGVTGSVWNVTAWELTLRPIESEEDVLMSLTLEQRLSLFGGTYDEVADYDSSVGDYDWSLG